MAAKKTKTPVTQIVVVLIVIILGIYLLRTYVFPKDEKPKDETKTDPGTTTTQTQTSNPKPSPTIAASGLTQLGNYATLKVGTKAEEVRWLQTYFNEKIAIPGGKKTLKVDGIFGSSETLPAVKSVVGKSETNWAEFKAAVDDKKNSSDAAQISGLFENINWLNL